jgi:hypothetical protein
MRQRLIQAILALVALVTLVGCTSCSTVRSQSDFDLLPHSTGVYGGSFIIHTWSYIGSDTSYDHFIYTYTHDNLPRHTHIRVAKGVVRLDFEARPYRLPDDGLHVVAQMRGGKVEGFIISTNKFGL